MIPTLFFLPERSISTGERIASCPKLQTHNMECGCYHDEYYYVTFQLEPSPISVSGVDNSHPGQLLSSNNEEAGLSYRSKWRNSQLHIHTTSGSTGCGHQLPPRPSHCATVSRTSESQLQDGLCLRSGKDGCNGEWIYPCTMLTLFWPRSYFPVCANSISLLACCNVISITKSLAMTTGCAASPVSQWAFV